MDFRLAALLYAIGAAMALLTGSLWLCPSAVCSVPSVDRAVLTAMNTWRHPALDAAFIAFTALGSIALLLPLSLLLALALLQRHRLPLSQALFLPLAVAGAAAWAYLAKFVVARPRPDLFPAVIDIPSDASFPSAHTLQVVAFATAWMLRPGRDRKFGSPRAHPSARAGETAILLLLMALVAVSRLYLQVHFPSDVLFAAVAAVLWILALRSVVTGQGAAR